MKLSAIQKTTQAVADAISEAVGLETEIISDEELIVAGNTYCSSLSCSELS